jgi:hypothetical protein
MSPESVDATTIAGVVSALAAVGALWFAWQTVRETRTLRREDRLARLPGLIADLGRFALSAGEVTPKYTISRAQVATMLAALDDPLPNCRLIAEDPIFANAAQVDEERAEKITLAALAEPAALMRSGKA